MNNRRGKFITVEGTEGGGKSTNIGVIRAWLESAGIKLHVTREPGGTPLAEEVRSLLLANREESVDATAELLLIFAARAQHLHTVIEPALARGEWVLCDRFTDATYAYQGGGRGLSLELISQLEQQVQKGVQPHQTFYLDIDVVTGLARAQERGDLDRLEREDVAFFERVRQAYWQRIKNDPGRFTVIDAGQSLDAVRVDLEAALAQLVANYR